MNTSFMSKALLLASVSIVGIMGSSQIVHAGRLDNIRAYQAQQAAAAKAAAEQQAAQQAAAQQQPQVDPALVQAEAAFAQARNKGNALTHDQINLLVQNNKLDAAGRAMEEAYIAFNNNELNNHEQIRLLQDRLSENEINQAYAIVDAREQFSNNLKNLHGLDPEQLALLLEFKDITAEDKQKAEDLQALKALKGKRDATVAGARTLFAEGIITAQERTKEIERIAAYGRYLDHTATLEDITLLDDANTIVWREAEDYKRDYLQPVVQQVPAEQVVQLDEAVANENRPALNLQQDVQNIPAPLNLEKENLPPFVENLLKGYNQNNIGFDVAYDHLFTANEHKNISDATHKQGENLLQLLRKQKENQLDPEENPPLSAEEYQRLFSAKEIKEADFKQPAQQAQQNNNGNMPELNPHPVFQEENKGLIEQEKARFEKERRALEEQFREKMAREVLLIQQGQQENNQFLDEEKDVANIPAPGQHPAAPQIELNELLLESLKDYAKGGIDREEVGQLFRDCLAQQIITLGDFVKGGVLLTQVTKYLSGAATPEDLQSIEGAGLIDAPLNHNAPRNDLNNDLNGEEEADLPPRFEDLDEEKQLEIKNLAEQRKESIKHFKNLAEERGEELFQEMGNANNWIEDGDAQLPGNLGLPSLLGLGKRVIDGLNEKNQENKSMKQIMPTLKLSGIMADPFLSLHAGREDKLLEELLRGTPLKDKAAEQIAELKAAVGGIYTQEARALQSILNFVNVSLGAHPTLLKGLVLTIEGLRQANDNDDGLVAAGLIEGLHVVGLEGDEQDIGPGRCPRGHAEFFQETINRTIGKNPADLQGFDAEVIGLGIELSKLITGWKEDFVNTYKSPFTHAENDDNGEARNTTAHYVSQVFKAPLGLPGAYGYLESPQYVGLDFSKEGQEELIPEEMTKLLLNGGTLKQTRSVNGARGQEDAHSPKYSYGFDGLTLENLLKRFRGAISNVKEVEQARPAGTLPQEYANVKINIDLVKECIEKDEILTPWYQDSVTEMKANKFFNYQAGVQMSDLPTDLALLRVLQVNTPYVSVPQGFYDREDIDETWSAT